ncbi:MAG: DUF6912 family protein [Actinomycetota bacterium]
MRVYLPATASDLAATELRPAVVHAVTPALRTELPGEDEETLELVAFLAAADDSVRLVAERSAPPRRVVLAAEIPDADLAPGSPDALETVRLPRGPLPWDTVVSIHVDEPDAAPQVAAAAAGDEAAFDALGEQDLQWFDVTERDAVAASLAG